MNNLNLKKSIKAIFLTKQLLYFYLCELLRFISGLLIYRNVNSEISPSRCPHVLFYTIPEAPMLK